mmetsp:Transcript_7704/g.25519  ORF Transcript_7704/g.25519 Transcript_7704/m.25519 type:complete len:206 (-) Transcript_7704:1591-2208(-)
MAMLIITTLRIITTRVGRQCITVGRLWICTTTTTTRMLRRITTISTATTMTTTTTTTTATATAATLWNAITRRAYDKKVVDHYENPRNVGSFDKSDLNVGTGVVGAPACGDVMKLQIKVDDEGNIVDSCFKTFGCGSAIASSSVATEWIKGTHVDEAVTIKNQDIAKHLNLPPVKLHCSMLAEDAIRSAVADIKAKRAAVAATAT